MITGVINVECAVYIQKQEMIFYELYKKIVEGEILCPNCLNQLRIHTFYQRRVILSEFETVIIKIMQVKCRYTLCGKTHAILPDFIVYKKQYEKKVIVAAITESVLTFCGHADDSTIRRWRRT